MPIAIVTGASSGIGRATAFVLAERGHDLGLTWFSDEENLNEVMAEIEALGRRAQARQADFTRPDDAPRVIDELAQALGGVDVLVNNAGGGFDAPFLEYDLDSWERTLALNLTSPFLAAQAAARRMVDQGRGGRIVNVTSVHAHVPIDGATGYVSAKHGLNGLTRQMALELAPHAITVNAVAPGEIATKMNQLENADPAEHARPGIPAGRPGHAREVAGAIAWLAQPDAAYTTGQAFVVDGGMLLMSAKANGFARAAAG